MRRIFNHREAYENGWTIVDDLTEITDPRFEEVYENPNHQETIRRIARSQDDWSMIYTRLWLKKQLIARKPERKYSGFLESVVDQSINKLYLGEEQYMAKSAAHVAQLEKKAHDKEQLRERILTDMKQELRGKTDPKVIKEFFDQVLLPKFSEKLDQDDKQYLEQELVPDLFGKVDMTGGKLILETKLFSVYLIVMSDEGDTIEVCHKNEDSSIRGTFQNGKFLVPSMRKAMELAYLPDPKLIDAFEQRVQEALLKVKC